MAKGSRWSARVALFITILMFGAVMGAFDAFGQTGGILPVALQTSTSPSPSASASSSPSPRCSFSPAPPPLCPSQSPPASSSPSPTPSGSASPGGGETHKSTISISYARTKFTGSVQSAAKCEPKRNVVVRKVRKGPDKLVGKATTNAKGKWSVPEADPHGRFYAKVLKRIFMQGDNEVTCGGAKSKVLKVG